MNDNLRKDSILDAAILSYAKHGKDGLKTKVLAKEAGCSEALIYRHFSSVDELLESCYMRLHVRVSELFHDISIPEIIDAESALTIGMKYWMKLFKFFVDAGYESLFYFDYRMSPSFKSMVNGKENVNSIYATSFMNLFEEWRVKFKVSLTTEIFRTFFVNTTGTFVIKVVNGDLPKTEDCYRTIRGLIFGGILSAVPGLKVLPTEVD